MADQDVPRIEPVFQRLRAWLGRELILDSTDACLYLENVHHPYWAVPKRELKATLEPFAGGAETYPRWTLVSGAGDRREDAAYGPPAPVTEQDLVVLRPHAADLWLEEDQPVSGAPRSPYHRVDVLASSRAVRFLVNGELIADTARPALLLETGIVPRWYVPAGDIAWQHLVPDATRTECPYKGQASYWRVDGSEVTLWSYQNPDPAVAGITGMLAIAAETPGVEILVDGRSAAHAGSR
jgi:uncharacterized protein (DUF427 family)